MTYEPGDTALFAVCCFLLGVGLLICFQQARHSMIRHYKRKRAAWWQAHAAPPETTLCERQQRRKDAAAREAAENAQLFDRIADFLREEAREEQ